MLPKEISAVIENRKEGEREENILEFNEQEEWEPGNQITQMFKDMVEGRKNGLEERRRQTAENLKINRKKLCGF